MYKYYWKYGKYRKIGKQTAKISNTEDDSQRMCFFTTFPVEIRVETRELLYEI